MPQAFPHAKFVFPSAALRRAELSNRAITSQWFDSGHPGLQQGRQYDDLRIEGLRESRKFLHGLIRDAITEVGASNVVVGGLSQGGATSMAAMLLWDREPIAAWFGSCTRVPFCNRIQEALDAPNQEEDVFERDPKKTLTNDESRMSQARDWLVEVLDFEDLSSKSGNGNDGSRGALFFGHGTLDTLVPMKLGQDTTTLFKSLGLDVSWNQYDGLEHWYSDEMLRDLVEVLAARFWKGRFGGCYP